MASIAKGFFRSDGDIEVTNSAGIAPETSYGQSYTQLIRDWADTPDRKRDALITLFSTNGSLTVELIGEVFGLNKGTISRIVDKTVRSLTGFALERGEDWAELPSVEPISPQVHHLVDRPSHLTSIAAPANPSE